MPCSAWVPVTQASVTPLRGVFQTAAERGARRRFSRGRYTEVESALIALPGGCGGTRVCLDEFQREIGMPAARDAAFGRDAEGWHVLLRCLDTPFRVSSATLPTKCTLVMGDQGAVRRAICTSVQPDITPRNR